jgi:hypothetical protein
MKTLLIAAVLLSSNAFAAEKCRKAVAKQIPKSAKLLDTEGYLLNPGEDAPYLMGEIWNDLQEPLEYYGYEKSNGYWGVYTAVGASLKDCKIKRIIDVGDDA